MEAVAYSNVRNNLRHYIDQVNENSDVVYITTQSVDNGAVLISTAEYENLLENAHIRSSSANMRRIEESIAELKAGLGKEHAWE